MDLPEAEKFINVKIRYGNCEHLLVPLQISVLNRIMLGVELQISDILLEDLRHIVIAVVDT